MARHLLLKPEHWRLDRFELGLNRATRFIHWFDHAIGPMYVRIAELQGALRLPSYHVHLLVAEARLTH